MQASTFNYPEGSHQLKEMEDDASFLTSSYVVSKCFFVSHRRSCDVNYLNAQVFLKRSKGLGDGVVGYGLHLTPSELGPKIVSVTSGGEAARTGLISVGVRVVAD